MCFTLFEINKPVGIITSDPFIFKNVFDKPYNNVSKKDDQDKPNDTSDRNWKTSRFL